MCLSAGRALGRDKQNVATQKQQQQQQISQRLIPVHPAGPPIKMRRDRSFGARQDLFVWPYHIHRKYTSFSV